MSLKANRKFTPQNDRLMMDAMKRYNVAYCNEKYLAAVDSVSRPNNDLFNASQGCDIQDIALHLCGSPYHSGLPQTEITPEVIIFWHLYVDALPLPF
jgi:hypothetical protein